MSTADRRVLVALQILVVAVPLLLGGRQAWTLSLAGPVVLALLLATLHARRQAGGGPPPTGVAALALFVGVALLTTVPLPPGLLRLLSPATAGLYADMLPGWPQSGGWSTWRTLAIDPYGVWLEVGRLALGFGVFAVLVAYPWPSEMPGEPGEARVLARLLATLVVAASAFAVLALIEQIAGNGEVLWISGIAASRSRASGPFINPNHFAGWLEMIVPIALAYGVTLGLRVRRRLTAAAQAGRGMGVNARRAWIAAVIANQRALALPLAIGTACVLMLIAHLATGSRGGGAALLIGLALAIAGMVAGSRRRSRQSRLPRWLPAAVGGALALASVAPIALWLASESDDSRPAASDVVDVSLTSRLAVASQGRAIVREHPLFGTGLGSWLHAYRPHQAPPVEGGIWDHAHNDYLELAAESGVAGVAAVLAFIGAVVSILVQQRRARRAESPERRHGQRSSLLPPGFELPEWRAALRDRSFLRWGLAGGLVAILVHSTIEFGLRMPANLLTLMLVTGLLVLAGRRQTDAGADDALALPPAVAPAGRSSAVALLAALTAVAALVPTLDTLRTLGGAFPISPRAALERADLALAEEGDAGRAEALALVHHALDWSPADREAHEVDAATVESGTDGVAALQRAIALAPWAAELRDSLAARLAADGRLEQAAAELEESMFRYPYLVSHVFMSEGADTPAKLLRVLADGDTMPLRLANLDDTMAGAIERGLTRALYATAPGETRTGVLNDLALLLEARERFGEAAALLRAEADVSQDGRASLARAARDALRENDLGTAEATLLAALVDTPEQGRLYRDLAVEVYAARGDFASAETVLAAGERNALDMLPVHRGMTEVIAKRAAAEESGAATAWAVADGDENEDAGE